MKELEFLMENFGLENPNLQKDLERISHSKRFKKGDVIVKLGEHPQFVYFIVSGIARGFLIDKSGKEITDCFPCRTGDACIACDAITNNLVSLNNMEALTECNVLGICIKEFVELLQAYPDLLSLHNHILVENLKDHWKQKRRYSFNSAKERYLLFLKEYPGLIDNIPHKYIASFLNMTPVSLSRIRGALEKVQN